MANAPDPYQPLLEVDRVTLQYQTDKHTITATDHVSFNVYRSDRFVVLGPSGCGKSTLLKAIGGFIEPAGGAIRLGGRSISEPGPDRVIVFQEFDQLLPWKTVKDNITFALINGRRCRSVAEAHGVAMTYLEKVKLTEFRDVYPHMLSGGMKQRVAIARGLAMQPAILLMDEPFAALDALTRRQMQEELMQLWSDARFTLLFVTHSIEEAVVVGSRILILSPHPGQVRAELNVPRRRQGAAGESETATLHRRIYEMLFGERAATAVMA